MRRHFRRICYYVYIIMQRTTIILPARLKELASLRARSAGMSFGEFVRRAVERAVRDDGARRSRRDPFFADRAVFNGDVPRNLSRRHDDYLYGEE